MPDPARKNLNEELKKLNLDNYECDSKKVIGLQLQEQSST